jgi:hypothetical protein
MKANYPRDSANWTAFLGVLLGVCLLATAVHADSLFIGTFKLTNEVHWGDALLGPGTYSLTLDQPARAMPIITVRDARSGRIVARTIASGLNHARDRGDSKLLIAVRGNVRAVSAVRLAGIGEVFQKARPFAAGGGNVEEARNSEEIPVAAAKK